MSGERIIRHLILPSSAPAGLIWLYFTPRTVFGCAKRGYLALAVVFLAMIAAIATTMKVAVARRRGENEAANWWTATTLFLVSPLVLLVRPLGWHGNQISRGAEAREIPSNPSLKPTVGRRTI